VLTRSSGSGDGRSAAERAVDDVVVVTFFVGATAFLAAAAEVIVVVFFVTDAVVFFEADAAPAALGLDDPAAVPINFFSKAFTLARSANAFCRTRLISSILSIRFFSSASAFLAAASAFLTSFSYSFFTSFSLARIWLGTRNVPRCWSNAMSSVFFATSLVFLSANP